MRMSDSTALFSVSLSWEWRLLTAVGSESWHKPLLDSLVVKGLVMKDLIGSEPTGRFFGGRRSPFLSLPGSFEGPSLLVVEV